jgi:adenosylhomocysteinase
VELVTVDEVVCHMATDPGSSRSVPANGAIGHAQIEWVRRHSPVLDGFVRERLSDGALSGVKLAVALQLEAKAAFFATVLADAGATVVVAGSNPRTTRGDVVQALAERGLTVVSAPGGDYGSWHAELLAAADTEPDYVIDDGAELTMHMARHRPELFARLKGVSEQTTTGTARLQALARDGRLPFAALTANNARCKHLFDNVYGTGQSSLQALLRLSNRQIAGAHLAVVGYGFVGRGIARYARAMGARTYVIETDPVRALEAHMDGHTVGSANDVLPAATMVVTATGGVRAVGALDLPLLRHDVLLANAGHHDLEIDVDALTGAATACEQARDGVDTYRLGEREIHLLAGGALVNIAGGTGHAVEIMDLSFAVQGLGAHHLATTKLEPGVYVIPKKLDDAIAAAKLSSLGVRLGQARADQADDLASIEGSGAAKSGRVAINHAANGRRRIAWAKRGMPVLASITERFAEEKILGGLRVGVCLVLEPKTANLALALQAAGAKVSVHCPGRSTTGSVARALQDAGLQVFAKEGASGSEDAELARAFLATRPDILLDDGASLIRMAHREFPDLVSCMLGAAEETTSGVRPLRRMLEAGELRLPVIAVNDARTKYLFDNVYGTGQSCVMALLDITNLQLAGRVVVVAGFGWVGQGVARHAAALGARVIVSEIDAVKALQAVHEGYCVQSLADAARRAEVVFAATGIAGAVTPAHLAQMPDGVILCTAGGGSFELPMEYLDSLGTSTEVRQEVTEYVLPTGCKILVISRGDSLNTSAAEGNPIEVMDLSLSLQALAAECITIEARNWGPGVYPVTSQMETAVALARLRHEGASLEYLTEQLSAAMRSW